MVAEKATLLLIVARSLFVYRISHSRGPWRICTLHIAYHIRVAHSIIPIIMCVCLGFIIIIVFAEKCVCDVFRLASTVFEAGNV